MTEKQIERVRTKIKKIRATLAAEKRMFGAYDDSRGLRYMPPGLFIQIEDYRGGLTYLRWFAKNFPDDTGFPDFLFEWIVILFNTGKQKDAEQKAFETFCSNTYLFDKFFDRPIVLIDKYEFSNLSAPAFTEHFTYSHQQPPFADFAHWLEELTATERFAEARSRFVDLQRQLNQENDLQQRRYLLEEERALQKSF